MTEIDKMHTGEMYQPGDPQIMQLQEKCLERLYDFNATRPSEHGKRTKLLREMFAEFGEGSWVEPPLHANWAGCFVHFGRGVYANFNLTLVDDTAISVGDHTMIGPNVTIATANHPILPAIRERGYQYNLPVRIGRNCWLGSGVIILPSVSIGDNTVVGAGSVVTKDLPTNVVAVGDPCRVLRPIGERDKKYYDKNRRIDYLQLHL